MVQVNAGTAAGTAINDTVTVSSSISDPNSANNSATANDVVALATQADLITTNSAVPASVAAGSNVTYTQTVTNNGPAAATSSYLHSNHATQHELPVDHASSGLDLRYSAGSRRHRNHHLHATAATLVLNATASFTLVLQVNAGTPSGTFIAESATASASNIVPNLTSNTATATVNVANANSADMAIVKSASPNPTVPDGDTLTYTLTVTNNGPATATKVTVTDPLPTSVTYLSSSSTQGTCSQAGGTVTCLLGSMNSSATATVTIITLAGAPGVAVKHCFG